MKYELQLVIGGFILGIAILAFLLVILNRDKQHIENCHKLGQIEIEAFYVNSFLCYFSIVFGTPSLAYAVGAAVQGYWAEKGASAFSVVLMFLGIALVDWLILFLKHPSILMSSYMDRKEYRKSLKQEDFVQYSKNIWVSENWIRVGERFVPKTCLVGIRFDHIRGSRRCSYSLLSVDGHEIYCRMANAEFEICQKDEQLLKELVTTKHFKTDLEFPATGLRSTDFDMETAFLSYLDKHEGLDLIHNDSFTDEVMEVSH